MGYFTANNGDGVEADSIHSAACAFAGQCLQDRDPTAFVTELHCMSITDKAAHHECRIIVPQGSDAADVLRFELCTSNGGLTARRITVLSDCEMQKRLCDQRTTLWKRYS